MYIDYIDNMMSLDSQSFITSIKSFRLHPLSAQN